MGYLVRDFRYGLASGDFGVFIGDLVNLGIVFGVPAAFLVAAWYDL